MNDPQNTPTDSNAEALAADESALRELPELNRLEAVLFLSREPLSSRKLSQLAGLTDGTQARSLIRKINRHYDEAGRSFNVQQVAGGFQLRTRAHFSMWLTRLQHAPAAIRLTAPAMETLAVVAYRQPVRKADIEAIRGVSCGDLLRQLLDRGMVRIAGRSSELGNPYLYGTTRRFLEVFGLPNLESLPRARQLRGSGLPAPPQPENPGSEPPNPLDESENTPQNLELVVDPDPKLDVLQQNSLQEE